MPAQALQAVRVLDDGPLHNGGSFGVQRDERSPYIYIYFVKAAVQDLNGVFGGGMGGGGVGGIGMGTVGGQDFADEEVARHSPGGIARLGDPPELLEYGDEGNAAKSLAQLASPQPPMLSLFWAESGFFFWP